MYLIKYIFFIKKLVNTMDIKDNDFQYDTLS